MEALLIKLLSDAIAGPKRKLPIKNIASSNYDQERVSESFVQNVNFISVISIEYSNNSSKSLSLESFSVEFSTKDQVKKVQVSGNSFCCSENFFTAYSAQWIKLFFTDHFNCYVLTNFFSFSIWQLIAPESETCSNL